MILVIIIMVVTRSTYIFLLSILISGSKRNYNTKVMGSSVALSTGLVKILIT
jgi:hypothetical protein